jgi:hypothetical protein
MAHANHDFAGDVVQHSTYRYTGGSTRTTEHNENLLGDNDNLADDEDSQNDAYLDQDTFLEDKDWLTHDKCVNSGDHMTRDVTSSDQSSGCTEHLPIADPDTTSTHTKIHIKRSSKFCSFVSKAKEHLRDEDNRKKAMQRFQTGVREVTEFVAEVQAKGTPGNGATGNFDGKKLAKVCVKVAMKRLAK